MPLHDHPAEPQTHAPAEAKTTPALARHEGGTIRAMFIAAGCSLGGAAAITGVLFWLAWSIVDHDASDGGMQALLLVAVVWFGIVILYPLMCLITLSEAPGPFRGVLAGVALPPLLIVGGAWLYFTQLT